MSFPARRSSERPKLVGNHNRCWIWGRHVVLETLRAGRWLPLEILISPRCAPDIALEVQHWVRQLGQTCEAVTDAALARRCRADEHQGLAALLPEFPFADLSDLLNQRPPLPRWLILDSIQDSFNFGAMLRSAVELGTQAVLIGTREQSTVNSQVARSSAGAVNHVLIARVEDLPGALQQFKSLGITLVAASEKATQLLQDCDLRRPSGIIIGNEGRGVSPDIWSLCDEHVRIPTTGRVGSLNAAVAAGIFCYERWRQCAAEANDNNL